MSQLTATVEIGHPSEVALLERYALMLREVRALAEATSMDQLIDVCEMSIIEKGREVSRSSLEEMVQERIDAVEKKRSCDGADVACRKRVVVRGVGRS